MGQILLILARFRLEETAGSLKDGAHLVEARPLKMEAGPEAEEAGEKLSRQRERWTLLMNRKRGEETHDSHTEEIKQLGHRKGEENEAKLAGKLKRKRDILAIVKDRARKRKAEEKTRIQELETEWVVQGMTENAQKYGDMEGSCESQPGCSVAAHHDNAVELSRKKNSDHLQAEVGM
jgi:hypothetical protein